MISKSRHVICKRLLAQEGHGLAVFLVLLERPRKLRTHVLCLSSGTLSVHLMLGLPWRYLVTSQTDPGESWPNPSSGIMYAVKMCSLSGVRQGVGDLSGQVLSLSGLFCPLITLSSLV